MTLYFTRVAKVKYLLPVVACTVLLYCLIAPAQANETVLVEDGRGRCTIIIPVEEPGSTPRGGRTIKAAAEDLVYHLEKMSGARIPIVSDPSTAQGVPIYIGVIPEGIELPVDLADESKFWPDGYLILADGKRVILAAPRIDGVSNAVYGLLEDYLGCHWFIPGTIGEHIPKRSTVKLNVEGGYQVAKRDMEYTQPGYTLPRVLDMEDEAQEVVGKRARLSTLGEWMRRNRYGGPRGEFSHNWFRIYTREVFEKYPDLAPFYGGKRHLEVSMGSGQVCLSNPKAVDVAAEYFIKLFTENPKYDFFSFGQNDGYGWCECDNCKAMASNDAGRVLIVANKVMERVAAIYPDKRITIFIYYNTFDPPKERIKAHKNLIGVICSAGPGSGGKAWMDQIKPKTDNHPDGILYRRKVERWMSILSSAWTYDYYGWFPGPYTMFHKLQAEHNYHVRLGFIRGDVSEYLDRNMGIDVLMWLSFHLGWDKNTSVDDLLKQFYPEYFGEAAEDMRYIYERLEKHMWTATTKGQHGSDLSHVVGLYPLRLLDDALARIAIAKGKVGGNKLILARIERDERCLRFTRMFMEAYLASTAYFETRNPENQKKAIAAVERYIKLHDDLNITLPRGARNMMDPLRRLP